MSRVGVAVFCYALVALVQLALGDSCIYEPVPGVTFDLSYLTLPSA